MFNKDLYRMRSENILLLEIWVNHPIMLLAHMIIPTPIQTTVSSTEKSFNTHLSFGMERCLVVYRHSLHGDCESH